MAESGQSNPKGEGISSPTEAQAFPASIYSQLLAGSSDGSSGLNPFPSWEPFGPSQQDASLGLNSGYRNWSPFGDFQNFAADTYAPSGHHPAHSVHYGMESLGHRENDTDSTFGPNVLSSLSAPVDFIQASEQGRELYVDAFHHIASDVPTNAAPASSPFSGKAYDPFGTNEVFTTGDSFVQPQVQPQFSMQGPHQAELSAKSAQPAKPSYSEVAKQKLSCSDTVNSKREHPVALKETMRTSSLSSCSSTSSTTGNTTKAKKSKPSVARSCSLPAEPKTIHPESRYGLDTFDDPLLAKPPCSWSSQSGGSSRKGSFSSEEVLLERQPGVNVYDVQGPGPGTGAKYHSQVGDIEQNSSLKSDTASKSTKVPEKKAKNITKTKAFFDPKRIFGEQEKQSVPTGKSFIPNNQQNFHFDEADAVLNNGKTKSNWKTSSAKYINNDLRDSKKQTNTETRNYSGMYDNSYLDDDMPRSNSHGKSKRADMSTGTSNVKKSSSTMTDEPVSRSTDSSQTRKMKKDHTDLQKMIGVWLTFVWKWVVWAAKEILLLGWKFTKLLLSVSLLILLVVWYYIESFFRKCWDFISTKLPFLHRWAYRNYNKEESYGFQSKARLVGLKENIALPTTGDEAMKRLLSCKGKDPYSILGLRVDASDDDIKRYYRRQAVLVHPDKNQQPGAEEAFKILGHAIELIGESEKRRIYDSQRTEAQEQETAMQEFSDLLTKLHEKMEEAANMMRCDHCGGKHKRVPMDRPAYSARYCSRCNMRHLAKEGDVWAESSVLGFLWHYYACMEGKVYDITEWASCQHKSFKCLQANAHQVIYRISTGANRHRSNSSRTSEDLEDFLSNLLYQSGAAPSAAATAAAGEPQSGKKSTWNQSTGANKRSNRKKKKKH